MQAQGKPDQSQLALIQLSNDVLDKVRVDQAPSSAAPAGAVAFPKPQLDLGPIAAFVVNTAINRLVATYGGTAEDYVLSHRDQILAVVPRAVLDLNQRLLDVVSTGKPTR